MDAVVLDGGLTLPFLIRRPSSKSDWISTRLAHAARHLATLSGFPVSSVEISAITPSVLEEILFPPEHWDYVRLPAQKHSPLIFDERSTDTVVSINLPPVSGPSWALEMRWTFAWARDWEVGCGVVNTFWAAVQPAGLGAAQSEIMDTLIEDGMRPLQALPLALAVNP